MGRFLILGMEERQKYLFQMICTKGHTVTYCDSWLDGSYDVILLPPARTAGYLSQVADKLQGNEYIFGCNFPEDIVADIQKNTEIVFIDYMKEAGAAYINAIATAEGAIAEAILAGKEVLYGKESLVMGYGRCGQVLAARLKALGTNVSIYEKDKEKVAMAKTYGLHIHTMETNWGQYVYIFNTIPELVLDDKRLASIRQDAVLIDIASKPGGMDYDYCRKHNLNAKLCSGLPTKYAPRSAAELLMQIIDSIFKEEVISHDAE